MKSSYIYFSLGLALTQAGMAAESLSTIDQVRAAPDWESLSDLSTVQEDAVAAIGVTTQEAIAEAFLVRAADLREFYTQQPEHEAVKEAQGLEALALVRAGWAGDVSKEVLREEVVADVRGDEEIPLELRSMVAAGFENLKIRRQTHLSRDERLAAFEAAVRGLIAEFGDPIAYESLFAIARSRSEESAVRVARELLEMPAPAPVKSQAETLLRRHAMMGSPLAEHLESAGADARGAFESLLGEPVVIYSWSTRQPASIAIARKLTAELPDGVGLVGLNFDLNAETARAAVQAEELRGVQLFAPTGPGDPTALALAMDRAPLVLVLNAKGVVTSVTAHRDLDKTIADFATP